MTVETILSRLQRVRTRGPGQHSACCPAHEDKGPSLSIKELPDGRVLLHCFAGCEVDAVLAAVGLEITDLFPPSTAPYAPPAHRRRLLTAGQALELLHDESNLVAVAAANIAHGVELGDDDRARVLSAAARIAYLREEATT